MLRTLTQKPTYFFRSLLIGSTRSLHLGFALFLLVFHVHSTLAQKDCALVCAGNLNVSLDFKCEANITSDLVLQNQWNPACSPNGPQAFTINVMKNGQTIPTSPKVTGDYIGQTLQVKVTHKNSGNSCWTNINIEDKQPPKFTVMVPDVTVCCTSPTDPSKTGTPTVTDCSGFTLSYTDQFINYNCGNPAAKIIRTWLAVDGKGNKQTCIQNIIIKKSTVDDVVFPKNIVVDCKNPNINPSVTGFPTIDGLPILTGGLCMISVTSTDQELIICSGTKKILRTWTAVDWCTSKIKTSVQIIEIKDMTPPIISCPGTIIGSSYSDQCKGSAIIPAATITDDCSNFSVVITGSWIASIPGNGGIFHDIPLGNHVVTYTATDGCGNFSKCTATLILKDNTPPTVVCDDQLNVSIPSNGKATVPAKTFDDGSIDNCCINKYDVKRMNESDSLFRANIMFTCADLGTDVMVILRVTDCSGNTNICMITVKVQDKLPPSIVCPADVTVFCPVDLDKLDQYGNAAGIDNCGNVTVKVTNNVQLSSCGTGLIKRVFTVTGSDGNTAACTQLVVVQNNKPFTGNDIVWPKDYDANACTAISDLEPDKLPAGFNTPQFNNSLCSFAGVSHNDEVFTIAGPACFKILRKWVVLDWCQYNPNIPNSPGRWEYTQLIKVYDNDKPVMKCPLDLTVSSTDQNCTGADVILPAVTATDCNPNVIITNSYNNGGANASGFYPLGTTSVIFSASDGCKNTATCLVKVSVVDAKKPTPVCINGLSLPIMPSTLMVTIWAKDFDNKSFDNCTANANLVFRIRKHLQAPSGPPADASIIFTCDDIGVQQVQVWVMDESGNWDYCLTNITITDNDKLCPPTFNKIALGGWISTENAQPVKDVQLTLNAKNLTTGTDGFWKFVGLNKGENFTITPLKDGNDLNGVSTIDILKIQKHILGAEKLANPYRYIAADVDKSGVITTKDMVDIRKMILQISDQFESNTSWRFIDAEYVFPTGINPLKANWTETIQYSNVTSTMNNLKFIGIKIGDVDGNASGTLANGNNETRSRNTVLSIENRSFLAGEVVEIQLNSESAIEVLQMGLKYRPSVLEFIDMKSESLIGFSTESFTNKEDGSILCSWNGDKQLENEPIVVLSFLARKSGQLANELHLIKNDFEQLTYTESNGEQGLEINWEGVVSHEENSLKLELYPNPINSSTRLEVYNAISEEVNLIVFDQFGRLVYTSTEQLVSGWQNLPIVGLFDIPTGSYTIQLKTGSNTVNAKFIVVKP